MSVRREHSSVVYVCPTSCTCLPARPSARCFNFSNIGSASILLSGSPRITNLDSLNDWSGSSSYQYLTNRPAASANKSSPLTSSWSLRPTNRKVGRSGQASRGSTSSRIPQTSGRTIGFLPIMPESELFSAVSNRGPTARAKSAAWTASSSSRVLSSVFAHLPFAVSTSSGSMWEITTSFAAGKTPSLTAAAARPVNLEWPKTPTTSFSCENSRRKSIVSTRGSSSVETTSAETSSTSWLRATRISSTVGSTQMHMTRWSLLASPAILASARHSSRLRSECRQRHYSMNRSRKERSWFGAQVFSAWR